MSAILRCSIGDCAILSGSLISSVRGNWTAAGLKVRPPEGVTPVALEELSAASLLLTREDKTVDTFTGAVRRSGVELAANVLHVTIVGGAGALLADVPARHHAPGTTEIPAGIIARAICDAAGELLADGVEAALDAFTVHQWTRFAMPGGVALDLLADVLGLGWRVLPTGRVWMGAETWTALEAEKRLKPDPDDGAEAWACDGAPILAGVTLGGRRIVEVSYQLTAGAGRATVRAAVSGDPPRAPALDLYRASYAATVVRQADDGTLELVPDDARLGDTDRSLLAVPLRVGIPGCKVTVPVGARVRVLFEGADPRGIYAAPLDQDPLATKALALLDDAISAGTIAIVAPPGVLGGPCTITYTPPGGVASVGATATLTGKITGPGHKYAKGVPAS